MALMVVGLAAKTALVPLHGWLPPAHGIAKSPVSALLSAVVVKASFYVLARLWLEFGDAIGGAAVAHFLGALGALAIVWGSWMALRQAHLKMLVAYSSVSQLGYLFLLFPLTLGVSETAARLAQQGVALHLLSHGLAKAAMFLAAGNLIGAVRSPRVDGLTGVSRFLPFSLFSFGLAAVSIMGLPPSGGFVAKWLLLQSSLGVGQWWWAVIIVLGALMSAAYVFRVFHASHEETEAGDGIAPPPRRQEAIPFVLAVMALGMGLVADESLHVMALADAHGAGP
jgi:formate hydrogenlyase subunit 3/multisubunit Na+/H+ antiporter MnhD subunit